MPSFSFFPFISCPKTVRCPVRVRSACVCCKRVDDFMYLYWKLTRKKPAKNSSGQKMAGQWIYTYMCAHWLMLQVISFASIQTTLAALLHRVRTIFHLRFVYASSSTITLNSKMHWMQLAHRPSPFFAVYLFRAIDTIKCKIVTQMHQKRFVRENARAKNNN